MPQNPSRKKQKSTAKGGSSFAAFKGLFAEIKRYFLSLVTALTAFLAFKAFVIGNTGWPVWTAWLAFIPPLLVFLWKTVPRLLEWRHKRVFIKSAEKEAANPQSFRSAASYFLIGPYGEDRRDTYARADNMHRTVLDWLRKTDEQILILTGSSGTGKSSLLNAFVIPELRESEPACTVLLVRSFDNPLDDLRRQLLAQGNIWDRPPDENSMLPLNQLIGRALIRLRKLDTKARLLVVFDQFEELIVLQTERSAAVDEVTAFLRALRSATGLEPQVILGCLLDLELSGYVRQISRPAEIANRIWEVSHDFVARLLGPILKTPFQTILGRVGRVLYPLSLGVWGLAAIALVIVTPWFGRMHSEQILRDRFSIFLRDEGDGYLAHEQDQTFKDLPGAIPYLVNFGSITVLDLSHCDRLTNVEELKKLRALRSLNLSGCTQLTNVEGLKELTSLQSLNLSGCAQLTNVDGLKELTTLQSLNLSGCAQLTNAEGLKELKALPSLDLSGCTQLTNVEGLKELTALQILDLSGCQLTNVEGLKELTALQSLNLSGCERLANVDALEELTALRNLNLRGCERLTNVDALEELTALQSLNLGGCTQLTNVDGLKTLKLLQTLHLSGTAVANVDALKELTALRSLELGGCTQLANADGLETVKSLHALDLSGTALQNVDALKELTALQSLELVGCAQLSNVGGLKELTNLQTLNLIHCKRLTNVEGLKTLTALRLLILNRCERLSNVHGLDELKSLQSLFMSGCVQLTNVDGLKELGNLQKLILSGCSALTNVAALKQLSNLQVLDLSKCNNLSREDVEQVRAAHPRTNIYLPDGPPWIPTI